MESNEERRIPEKNRNKILEVKKLSKVFPSRQANSDKSTELRVFEDISFSLGEGEIIAIVGPSGCGKTTILNIIAGLLKPDNGQILMDNKRRISYIFQEPRLLPWKTVQQNLGFIQENYLAGDEAFDLRERLLESAGLYEFRESYPAELSGGMKQRLELIRALSIRPELIMMDEPFKSIDISLKYKLQEILLEEYEKEKFSILFITHDPEDAVLLADRILILSGKPTGIIKEMEIDVPRRERNLKEDKIYNKLEEILEMI